MLPDPLHPAVVHLPVALAVLLPLLSHLGLLAIERHWLPVRAWSVVVLLTCTLVLGSWAAMSTGEADEERVESVVAESYIEAHEEAAEGFLAVSVVLLAVASLGLASGRAGRIARMASLPLTILLLVAGARVGHLGGELVYERGAAMAHVEAGALGSGPGVTLADDDSDSD